MKCSSCSSTVRPIVSLDIDGTIGRYHYHFLTFLAMWTGDDKYVMKEAYDYSVEFSDYCEMSKEEYRRAKLAYRQGGWKRSMPVFPALNLLMDAIREEGCELWIATTRPWQRLDNVDPDTREFLRRNHVKYDYILYGEDKYTQLTEQVHPDRIIAVFDDLPEQVQWAHDLNLPIYQVNHGGRSAVGVQGVQDVPGLAIASEVVRTNVKEWRNR